MTPARPRIGLAGAGRWGQLVLRDLRALGCEVAVADPSPEAREAVRGAAFATVSSASRLPACEGFVVASATSTHAEVCSELLERGVPVFVEKPMCASSSQARELAARGAGRLFVMHKWRYHAGVERLGQLAREGGVGRVQGLHSLRLGWDGPHPDVEPAWILAPHDCSIAIEILGHLPAPREAWTQCWGGATVGLAGRLGSDPWFQFEATAAYPGKRRELRLQGEAGTAFLPAPDAREIALLPAFDTRRESVPAPRMVPVPPAEPPLRRELRDFLGHLEGGPPPRSDAAEGAAVVAAIERLIELSRCDSR